MVMAKTKYVFFNGEIVPHDEAKVHVSTTAFKFGAAVFEGVRGYWNEQQEQLYLFRMPEHMQRLVFSQRMMRFEEVFRGRLRHRANHRADPGQRCEGDSAPRAHGVRQRTGRAGDPRSDRPFHYREPRIYARIRRDRDAACR